MTTRLYVGAALLCLAPSPGLGTEANVASDFRAVIQLMRENPRGPFERIRWFCNDGTVQAPVPYACAEHGGGRQHGEWSAATRRIRAAGYPIANVLAELGPGDFDDDEASQRHLRILLLERFLINADDGWILRGARYYRGAFQIEDEVASAHRILAHLVTEPKWRTRFYPMLVEAVRLLPGAGDGTSALEVRGMATALNGQDPEFAPLRNKIHNKPDKQDAQRVREYAAQRGKPALRDEYEDLAARIERLYQLPDPVPLVLGIMPSGPLGERLLAGAAALVGAEDPATAIGAIGSIMATVREDLDSFATPAQKIEAVRLILALEAQVFARAQPLLARLESGAPISRAEHIHLLRSLATAVYGIGLITEFERDQIERTLGTLAGPRLTLAAYREGLGQLERTTGWAARRLAFFFEEAIESLADLEPLAREYIPDRLRGSPLLHYSRVLTALMEDATVLAGVRHEVLGRTTVTGLRPLNPGTGRGALRTIEELEGLDGESRDTIVIAEHTVAELPVVAGILTGHEGNALSHVQLLARNLGIPNVVVGPELMPMLRAHTGTRVILTASPKGIVRLNRDNTPETHSETAAPPTIVVDVTKLDLETTRPLSTHELNASDSGVRVGPKAAQLSVLTRQFPERVSRGLAIPFGAFRQMLDRPKEAGGPTVFEWMQASYADIRAASRTTREQRTKAFLAELRAWIESAELNPDLAAKLREDAAAQFGPHGTFGVFVRSDTNVEDLPNFTGAGLNLTVPNVVGFDNIVAAVRKVWASPFTERAYGWRQALMDKPEHLYAAVLLHKSVNADKSGVLITADVDSGDRGFITVVANEGVGGGVEGQSSEALKIRLSDGAYTLLNSATAPRKRVLLASGGSALVPASGAPRILTDRDLQKLRELTREVEGWFGGGSVEEPIADIEFGFEDGELRLFQIRPFVPRRGDPANDDASDSLDAGLARSQGLIIDMRDVPHKVSS